jgi:hypothetical protein
LKLCHAINDPPSLVPALRPGCDVCAGLTVPWPLLIVVQGLPPAATVYLARALTDALVAVGSSEEWEMQGPVCYRRSWQAHHIAEPNADQSDRLGAYRRGQSVRNYAWHPSPSAMHPAGSASLQLRRLAQLLQRAVSSTSSLLTMGPSPFQSPVLGHVLPSWHLPHSRIELVQVVQEKPLRFRSPVYC